MKTLLLNLLLAILLLLALFPIDIADIPAYSVEEVLALAKVASPDCKIEECG
jgi:hypothetical protein